MVQLSDLKSEPVLWHEDSGRRPWANGKFPATTGHLVERSIFKRFFTFWFPFFFSYYVSFSFSLRKHLLTVCRLFYILFFLFFIRHNPPGSVTGRKLGEASHRLIANSLQLKVECNGFSNNMQAPSPSYGTALYIPPLNSSVNYGFPLGRDNSSAVLISEFLCKLGPSSQGYYHYQINDPTVLKKLNLHPQRPHRGGGSMQLHQKGGDNQQKRKRNQPFSGNQQQRGNKQHRYNSWSTA